MFHYYSPLSYYVGAAYGIWFGGAVAGVKFVLVLSAYLGAAGMYLFVRDRWGPLAGIVSAASFSLAPYVVYIDPHARGDSPETLAIGLAPLMLWAFARLRRTASPGDVVLAAVLLAALVLSHNLMAIVFFGILLAWLAWDLFSGHTFFGAWVANGGATTGAALRRKVLLGLTAAVVLGLGLAAFMWLPAVAERDAVQFRNVASGTYFDFRRWFISVEELFAPAQVFDLGATQMRFNYSVGLAQAVLAGLGMLTVFFVRTRRLSVLFFSFAGLGLVYLMLPSSIAVWEAIPPLAFFQFPTRFLGPAAVVLGVLAGASLGLADYLPWRHSRLALASLAVAAFIAGAMPLLHPPAWPEFGPVTAQRILDTELNGRGVGTTSANDFLPVGAVIVPPPQPSLIASYATGTVDKVNRATLPEGTRVDIVEHSPQRERLRIAGDSEFLLRIFTFYFPGWTAYVDGQEVPITLSEPEGWITFWVPAGQHDVVLQLENTPVRWVAGGLAALSFAVLLAMGLWRMRLDITRPQHEALAWRPALALGVLLAAGLAVRLAAGQAGWWQVRSTGHNVLVADHQRYAPMENDIALLAYDLPRSTARSGQVVPVTLYWKALAPMKVNLRVFVHLLGPDGQLWGQSDKWNPADYPTGRWPLDLYVRDEHAAQLQPGAPPGTYTVVAGLWNGETGSRMRLLDANGNPLAQDGVVLSDSFVVSP